MKDYLRLLNLVESKQLDFNIKTVPKRMDSGDGCGRDWHARVIWEASFGEEKVYHCEWEGFETAEECFKNLIDNMELAHVAEALNEEFEVK